MAMPMAIYRRIFIPSQDRTVPRKQRIDMIGFRAGRLIGLAYSHTRAGHAHWLFACDCGNESVINGAAVRSGKTESCGCLHKQVSAERLTTHGRRAGKRHDATYRSWQEINNACTDRNSPRYRDHGAVGITVCPEWRHDFEAFLADLGERPPQTKLVRIATAKTFSRDNCRWAPVRSRPERAIAGWDRLRRTATLHREPAL